MKKQSIFTIVAMVAVFVMTSCNKYEAKEVSLSNQNDSLNYALGMANGDGIKSYYLQNDSTDQPILALMKALDEAYKSDASSDEMYKLGVQIGNSFSQQKQKGLMGDSTLVFDEKLVKQGLVNALNGFTEGMTSAQAEEYIRNEMMKIQQQKWLNLLHRKCLSLLQLIQLRNKNLYIND